MKRTHGATPKHKGTGRVAAHLSHMREDSQKECPPAHDPATWKPPDPVDTVMDIMDAASNVVEWVDKHWDLSDQELNAHCQSHKKRNVSLRMRSSSPN